MNDFEKELIKLSNTDFEKGVIENKPVNLIGRVETLTYKRIYLGLFRRSITVQVPIHACYITDDNKTFYCRKGADCIHIQPIEHGNLSEKLFEFFRFTPPAIELILGQIRKVRPGLIPPFTLPIFMYMYEEPPVTKYIRMASMKWQPDGSCDDNYLFDLKMVEMILGGQLKIRPSH